MTTETSKANYKFTQNILKVSHSKTLDEAISEWEFREIEKKPENGKCLCQHILHKEIHYYQNVKNGNVIGVGQDCAKKFNFLQETKSTNGILREIWNLLKGEYSKIDNLFEYCLQQKKKLAEHLQDILNRTHAINQLQEKYDELNEIIHVLEMGRKDTSLFQELLTLCDTKIKTIRQEQESLKKAMESQRQKKEQEEQLRQAQLADRLQRAREKEIEEFRLQKEIEHKERKDMEDKNRILLAKDAELEKSYIAQLSPRDRELHELAVQKLGSSYFVKRTHGYKKWLAAQSPPTHNTRSQATK